MKKIFILLAILIIVIACVDHNQKKKNGKLETSPLELRQLVKTTDTKKYTHGAFFLISGSVSSSEKIDTKIKVFAKVDSTYRMLEIPMDLVRINICDSLAKPTLIVKLKYDELESDTKICDKLTYRPYYIQYCQINCTEEMLPERLLPINL